MSRRAKLGTLPTLEDVRSAMTNALRHFKVQNEDIDLMARAVKRLYDMRLKERGIGR
jgi:hypothetical protein